MQDLTGKSLMEIHSHSHEKLPSGKTIIRYFDKDGLPINEQHGYGLLEIAIAYEFDKGSKLTRPTLPRTAW